MAGEQPVGEAERHAGLQPRDRTVLLHPRALPVVPDVDEDRIGLRLAVEAGAAGAEHDRGPVLGGGPQQRRDVGGVARPDDRHGDQPVGAGVGRVADEVSGAAQNLVGSERRDQAPTQRLRRPLRDPGGSAVVGRLRVGGGERGHHSIHMPDATGT